MLLTGYLIDQQGIDWPTALSAWSWILPRQFTLWLMNRFADLFIVLEDGTVHIVDTGRGTITKLAENRADFGRQIDEVDNARDWLMIPLVDKLVAAGKRLAHGECYGLVMPPILGGDYVVENCAVYPIADYLGAYGSVHNQLRDLPEGTAVEIQVINVPGRRD